MIWHGQRRVAEVFELAGFIPHSARELARPAFTPKRNGFIPFNPLSIRDKITPPNCLFHYLIRKTFCLMLGLNVSSRNFLGPMTEPCWSSAWSVAKQSA
jgi:hypothetical protein